jgi:hypothetical protein
VKARVVKQPSKPFVGQRFGKIIVTKYLGYLPSPNGRRRIHMFECRCECGKLTSVRNDLLLRPRSIKSCGCALFSAGSLANGVSRIQRHGMSQKSEYRIWGQIKRRCHDKDNPHYGGRGISLCKRWYNFSNFLADMGPRPSPKHSVERNNYNLGYKPSNCRWILTSEQNRNTSRNVNITIDGRTQCLSEWSRESGVSIVRISQRLDYEGWDPKNDACLRSHFAAKRQRDRRRSNLEL